MMIRRPKGFTPPPVSKYYRYDWQYAVDIYKSTALTFVSLLLLIVPSIIDAQKASSLSMPLGLWFSAVAYLLAMSIIYFLCPKFIREFRDFGQYKARLPSHRWIVWEFYTNLNSLAGWKNIVRETVAKGISLEIEQLPDGEIKTELARIMGESEAQDAITVYKPENFNRDIYLPIRLQDQKIVLFLEEDDEKLPEKEKELFWILYSEAANQKTVARAFFWILIHLSVIIGILTVLRAISQIAFK